MRVLVLAAFGLAALGLPHRTAGDDQGPAVKTFEVVASRYQFEPAVLEVAAGDEVELILRSNDTAHGLEIKELGVKVKIPKGGERVTVLFRTGRAGTFPITCSEYCGSGHRRMKASLVVTASEPR